MQGPIMRSINGMNHTACFFAAFACLAIVGCGESRPKRVPVAGTVLIDGAPLTMGSVMFVHPDSRPSAGMIDSNGCFHLSCYEPGDGAVIGKHQVKVTACQAINDRSSRWLAPKKYADTSSSGIEIEITEPKDDVTINLSWDGGKPFIERW
jgi:hypothetical protein